MLSNTYLKWTTIIGPYIWSERKFLNRHARKHCPLLLIRWKLWYSIQPSTLTIDENNKRKCEIFCTNFINIGSAVRNGTWPLIKYLIQWIQWIHQTTTANKKKSKPIKKCSELFSLDGTISSFLLCQWWFIALSFQFLVWYLGMFAHAKSENEYNDYYWNESIWNFFWLDGCSGQNAFKVCWNKTVWGSRLTTANNSQCFNCSCISMTNSCTNSNEQIANERKKYPIQWSLDGNILVFLFKFIFLCHFYWENLI